MDVAVVGGGIVGLSSAYYLARRGASVTVFEQGSLGNGSTERSVGGIRRQFSTPINVELSKMSLEVWETFEEEFGVDIEFRQSGYLFLARTKETATQFERTVEMHHDHEVPTKILTPDDAKQYCPELRANAFKKATYLGTDGFADPHLALQGFATRLPEVGASLETGTHVTDIVLANDRVSGIEVDGRTHAVDAVVNASGAWARRVGQMAGVTYPVAPRRRSVLIVDPESVLPNAVPLTIDLDTGSYFRPEREGSAIVGGHFDDEDPNVDPDSYSEKVSIDYTITALERAANVATYFGPNTEVKDGWAGLYAVTPDDHPIIEETIPGFVSAVGFSGHGFQHAPGTGQLVADIILDGSPASIDISALASERFERGDLLGESHVA